MSYASVNGLQLYYETHGDGPGRPLVLLHGGLMTIDLNFGPLLAPLAATRPVIAVELQGHGHTADTSRPMTIPGMAGDVIALLDQLGIDQADFFGFSLGGMVTYEIALSAPERAGRLVIASADAHRPPGRESVPLDEARLPTQADFQAMVAAYRSVAPDPGHFEAFAARNTAMVHELPAWTDEQLRALRAPVLLVFGDRDFWLLPDIAELFARLPDAQLAVLPGTAHMGVGQHPDLLPLVSRFLDAG
jgi:pimeloyl-ACP methyl ester carboxylesterase